MPSTTIVGHDGTARGAEAVALAGALGAASDSQVLIDSAAQTLQTAAEEHRASLIVLGRTHERIVGRAVLGTTAARLLHDAPCAVAVAPEDYAAGPLHVIGVAYDGSPEARAAVGYAGALARRVGATVRILVVADLVPTLAALGRGRAANAGTLERARQEARDGARRLPDDVPVDTRVCLGDPADELLAACGDGVDVLVCGSRGVGALRSAVGDGVSGRLVAHAPCPVIVLPRAVRSDRPALLDAARVR